MNENKKKVKNRQELCLDFLFILSIVKYFLNSHTGFGKPLKIILMGVRELVALLVCLSSVS